MTTHAADLSIPVRTDLTAPLAAAIAQAPVPFAVAYVDEQQRPHLSLRGTVQVWGSDTLAMWARSRGLPDAVSKNPHVALLYMDLPNLTYYVVDGRARGVDDPEVRERVYTGSPEREQQQDADRQGTAVLIDVDAVHGRGPDGVVDLSRSGTA